MERRHEMINIDVRKKFMRAVAKKVRLPQDRDSIEAYAISLGKVPEKDWQKALGRLSAYIKRNHNSVCVAGIAGSIDGSWTLETEEKFKKIYASGRLT